MPPYHHHTPCPLVLGDARMGTGMGELEVLLVIVIFQMGNKWERAYRPPCFNGDSWREAPLKHPAKPEHGAYRLLVNSLTSEELQEHGLQFDTLADFQRYLDFFGWREREDCIVNAKFMNYQQGRQLCGSSFRARVYIEHIPVRLSDIQDIPFPENLYVLLSALEGFEKLQVAVGTFTVTEDLICMDKDGRVKAWLNADLSRCIPAGDTENREGRSAKLGKEREGEEQMVEQIIRLVEENTTEDIGVGMTVTNFIRLNNRAKGLTFKQAKQEVLSYADRYQTEIPNYFESVIGIFDDKPSENDSFTEPHFNNVSQNQPNKEAFDYRSQSNPGSSRFDKVTGAINRDSLNRIPAYSQVHRADRVEDNRPGSAIYSLSHHPQEQPQYYQTAASYSPPTTGTINRSSFKVSFKYQGSDLPPTMALPVTPPPPPEEPTNSASMLKVKSATFLPKGSELSQGGQIRNLAGTSSLKDLLSNNKLVYSDSSTTYELDAELTEDMIRYLVF